MECESEVERGEKQVLYDGSYRALGLCADFGTILRTTGITALLRMHKGESRWDDKTVAELVRTREQ